MILLPPNLVFETFLGIDVEGYAAEKGGVAKKTLKNWKKGGSPRQSKVDSFFQNFNSFSISNNPERIEIKPEDFGYIHQMAFPTISWKPLTDGCRKGGSPDCGFEYTLKFIDDLDEINQEIGKIVKENKFTQAYELIFQNHLFSQILGKKPSSISGEFDDLDQFALAIMPYSLKILLAIVASFDVENARKVTLNFLFPAIENNKESLPFRQFFDKIIKKRDEKMGDCKSIHELSILIAKFENNQDTVLEKDPDTVLRNLHRWRSGEVIPKWTTINKILKNLFPEAEKQDRFFLYCFSVLFQKIYLCGKSLEKKDECKSIESAFDVFDPYPQFCEIHAKRMGIELED